MARTSSSCGHCRKGVPQGVGGKGAERPREDEMTNVFPSTTNPGSSMRSTVTQRRPSVGRELTPRQETVGARRPWTTQSNRWQRHGHHHQNLSAEKSVPSKTILRKQGDRRHFQINKEESPAGRSALLKILKEVFRADKRGQYLKCMFPNHD